MNLKKILVKNFKYLHYFYKYLHYRIFVVFLLSLSVGVLDGLGLAMFIPLLQMFNKETVSNDLGKLEFVPQLLADIGLPFTITTVLILIVVFFVLKGIAKYIQSYVAVIYMQYFMRKIRVTNITLMNSFKYSDFVTSDSGRIQNTFTGEVEKLNRAFTTYMRAMQSATLILVYLVLALGANFSFAVMVAIGGGATNLLFKYLYKKTKRYSREITIENHQFQGLLIQHVAFFKYLKATGLNRLYSKKLIRTIINIENIQRKIGRISAVMLGGREPLIIIIVVGVILIQIRYFDTSIGAVILSLLLLYRALTFLMAMQAEWNGFLSVSGSLENMEDFVSELKAGKEKMGNKTLKKFDNKIELKNVSFCYENNRVLNNINLEIFKNETIALVGPSGSGKTTLMNALSGLLIPQEGEIEIDGIPYSQMNLYSIKEFIGYISQESPSFSDTIYNNITFWDKKTDSNFRRFEEALKKASIFDFVQELPLKEETLLGNNGINVSGGQKQRLAIARELYKDTELLFMDEATSALDGETEAIIQSNIDNLKGECTIIMIAHRLATIKNVDRIILLNKGKVEAMGSFKNLSETSGKFREMINLQGLE